MYRAYIGEKYREQALKIRSLQPGNSNLIRSLCKSGNNCKFVTQSACDLFESWIWLEKSTNSSKLCPKFPSFEQRTPLASVLSFNYQFSIQIRALREQTEDASASYRLPNGLPIEQEASKILETRFVINSSEFLYKRCIDDIFSEHSPKTKFFWRNFQYFHLSSRTLRSL